MWRIRALRQGVTGQPLDQAVAPKTATFREAIEASGP